MDDANKFIKFESIQNNYETIHSLDLLPCFGKDLSIYEDCNIIPLSSSILGICYRPSDGANMNIKELCSLLAGEMNFYVTEIEVYQVNL